MNGKQIRIEKLFNRNKNAVIVAIDHGMFDGPIEGMIDIKAMTKKLNPQIDGVLLSPGMLKVCRDAFSYKGAPMPIVRINWSDVYCFHLNYNKGYTVAACSVKDAIALGAEAVVISLTVATGKEEIDAQNVEIYGRLMNEAQTFGVPVIGEFFPVSTNRLISDQLHDQVYTGCRILSELGADLIKTIYTNDFKKVIDATPLPVFVHGSEKTPTQLQALQLAAAQICDGAKGVVFGRNVVQVPNPFDFQSALCDVVKNGLSPNEALEKYKLVD